jgi:hypothetical protein
MGSYAVLELGGHEILMGKNHHVWTHQTIFQDDDLTWISGAKNSGLQRQKRGYKARLGDLLPRLELMGINLDRVRWAFENPHPSYDEIADVSFERLLQILHSVDFPFASEQKGDDRTPGIGSLVFHMGPYEVCRLIAERPDFHDLELVWDFMDVVEGGWYAADDFSVGLDAQSKILLITEGTSDISVIRHALNILRPKIADFFTFIDMGKNYPFPGAGDLRKFVEGLNAIGVQNRALAIFDNDSAGVGEMADLSKNLLPNLKVAKLPDLEVFRMFPTIGPSGETILDDINGRACGIESYLDLLPDDRIRWGNPARKGGTKQGAFDRKSTIRKDFMKSKAGDAYDFSKIEAVLDLIQSECSSFGSK